MKAPRPGMTFWRICAPIGRRRPCAPNRPGCGYSFPVSAWFLAWTGARWRECLRPSCLGPAARWVRAVSSLAGLWALVVWRWAPESPYWAAGKGEQELARQSIARLAQGRLEMDLNRVELVVEEYKLGSFLELFHPKLLVVTTLQSVLNFCFCWGYWALATWMPLLLTRKGLSVPEGNEFMALTALIMFPGYMSASWLTHRYGRKKIMVSFVSFAAIFGFLFAQSATLSEMYLWSFGLYFFNQGAWGVWDTWMGELIPLTCAAWAIALASPRSASRTRWRRSSSSSRRRTSPARSTSGTPSARPSRT